MFLAKFQQVTGDQFATDKNGNKPFIGELIAGIATGSIINGTMFLRDGLQPNKLYACDNVIEEYEGKEQVRTRVLSEVSLLEVAPLVTQLGSPELKLHSSTEEKSEPTEKATGKSKTVVE